MENRITLMFDGIAKECTVETDANGEYVCTAEDGRFVKFAGDVNLETAVEKHNEANSEEVEVIPDVIYGDVITFDNEGKEIK